MNYFYKSLLLAGLFLAGCKQHNYLINQNISYQNIDSQQPADSSINAQVSPYKAQLAAQMNEVVARSEKMLEKAQPESTLGNFISDIIAQQASSESKLTIDLAFMNYGGLRIGNLPQGEWTKGLIFELLPFDNAIVVVELTGAELNELLDFIAQKGGLPVSGALRSELKNGKLEKISLNNQPINPSQIYKIATIDYLANGGDNCKVLIGKKRVETSLLLRDAVLNYLKANNQQTQTAKLEGRMRGA